MNQGIHTIDLLLWFLGPVKRVSATLGLVAHAGIEVEDIAVGWIEFANGARATLAGATACWSATGFPPRSASMARRARRCCATTN